MDIMRIFSNFENDHLVTVEWMDSYISDIKCLVLQRRLSPDHMRIVENYNKLGLYKKYFKKINFKETMKQIL